MSEGYLPGSALFRLAWRCPWREVPPRGKAAWGRECILPATAGLAGASAFAEVFLCWNEEWLAFAVEVKGKRRVRPYPEQFWLGDSVELWLDTRDVRNAHRLSRFCHHFVLLPPAGRGGPKGGRAFLAEDSPAEPLHPGALKLASRRTPGGYRMELVIEAEALVGYDPLEHPRLGFNYHVNDLELGAQWWTFGRDFPIWKDPSLWGTLILAREEG